MIDLENLDLRILQKESAKALSCMEATNVNIHKFNKEAFHNSQAWYKAVINWYISEYGGMPSEVGPGKNIKLVLE
jgi:hypothetical protein